MNKYIPIVIENGGGHGGIGDPGSSGVEKERGPYPAKDRTGIGGGTGA